MFRNIVISFMCISMVIAPGCLSSRWTVSDWQQHAPDIQRAVRTAAAIILSRPEFSDKREDICNAITKISDSIDEYTTNIDPSKTFNDVRIYVGDQINTIPNPIIREKLIIIVLDILDIVENRLTSSFDKISDSDNFQVVAIATKAMAAGLKEACQISQEKK